MTPKISVHDNEIRSYIVDGQEQKIVLHTVSPSYPPKLTDVYFNGVAIYYFGGDYFSNILFNISEIEIEAMLELFKEVVLYAYSDYFSLQSKGEAQVAKEIRERHLKAFVIRASMGLGGFVLCNEMQFVMLSEPRVSSV